MKTKSLNPVFLSLLAFLGMNTNTSATMVWDLKANWSNTQNPNGVWTYLAGSAILPYTNSWRLNPSLGGWLCPNLPFWFQAPATNGVDWGQGDIIVHTQDPYNGGSCGTANVTWTSPINGLVSISGAAWHAANTTSLCGGNRTNAWSLIVLNNTISSGTVACYDTNTRANPFQFSNGSGGPSVLSNIPVSIGDVITLQVVRVSCDGYFVGLNFTITGVQSNILAVIPTTNILETVPWQYTPTTIGSGYTFGLSNAPAGMTVGTSSGTISWTPSQQQANQTYSNITYAVYQSGSTIAWTNFNVVVLVSNTAPGFQYVIGTQTLYATTTLQVSDPATNSDIWATSLTYGLVSAPSGAGINPATGLVSWTPTSGQVGSNTLYVSATDYDPYAVNSQNLSVTNSFQVNVLSLTPPSFTQQPSNSVVSLGQGFTFTASTTGFPTPIYQWQFSTNDSTWSDISGATGASYALGTSGLTNIGYYRLVASNSQGTNDSSVARLTFLNINMFAGLIIYGPVGAPYSIQSTPSLTGNWTTLTNISLPSFPYIYIDYSSLTNQNQFYRAQPQ